MPGPGRTGQRGQGLVYIYTQVYCGLCGRYITDLGGVVSAAFAAEVSRGESDGPGPDIRRRLPECFTDRPRASVQAEQGLHGLEGTANIFEAHGLGMQRDPRLPRLFLQPWFCFH